MAWYGSSRRVQGSACGVRDCEAPAAAERPEVRVAFGIAWLVSDCVFPACAFARSCLRVGEQDDKHEDPAQHILHAAVAVPTKQSTTIREIHYTYRPAFRCGTRAIRDIDAKSGYPLWISGSDRASRGSAGVHIAHFDARAPHRRIHSLH